MGLLRRADRHSRLMGEMMRRTGVDLSRESGLVLGRDLRAATAACMGCDAEQACAHWLAEAQDGAEPPDFCRNVDIFRRLSGRD
ncbi:DUF6455 family protein [Faunimonas sp. B44]|uniref:DUF6455 family protein n=1 Tax=Faunimonas sp. B44 TaxID=3461493 RepID=UPI0040440A4A